MKIGYKNRKRMRGVSIAFFSIGSFTITALTGLTVDGTAMYIERLQAQLAADAAALAAAQYACPTGSQASLASSAYINAVKPIVTERGKLLASLNRIDDSKSTMTWPYTDNQDWVGATVTREYTFKFLAAIGFNKANISAKAIAEAGSHEDDRFQDDAALVGRLAVDLVNKGVVDSWDSRSGTYVSQATNTDSHTGLKYAYKGANVRSDCLIKIRGKNYISGSALVAGDGIDCSELATHLDNRGDDRENDGDELEDESGSPPDLYEDDEGSGHDEGDDGHEDEGDGHDEGDDGHSSGGDDDDDGHARGSLNENEPFKFMGAPTLVLGSGGDDDDDGGGGDGGHDEDEGGGHDEDEGGGHDEDEDGEPGDGDILLHGRNRKRDADFDRWLSSRWLERCLKAYGQEYTADNDDEECLRRIADNMESEGKEYKTRATKLSGDQSYESETNGQKLCDEADDLRDIADDIDGEGWTCHNTPSSNYAGHGHDDSGGGHDGDGGDSGGSHDGDDGHDSNDNGHDEDDDGPGVRDPHMAHCGIIEIRGSPNHIQKDAIADGPIIFRGTPKVSGAVLPYNDVDPIYSKMTKPDWTTIATSNNNSQLSTFGAKWNSSTRRLKFHGTDDVTIPAGNYYVKDLLISGHATVRIDPNVTFWVDGKVRIGGHADVNPALDAKRLTFNMKCPATGTCYGYKQEFQASGRSRVAALVFNEDGDVDITQNSEIYGNLVSGKMIQVRGASSVHLDRAAAAATNRCGRHSRLIF